MKYDPFIAQSIASAGHHIGELISLLYEGVAFQSNCIKWDVFSHDGDWIGEMTTADVSFVIHYMKRLGREVGKSTCLQLDGAKLVPIGGPQLSTVAFTFAWVGWHPTDVQNTHPSRLVR